MLENVKRTWGKGLAVSLAIAGLFVFAGCGNKQAQQQKTGAVAVKSMQVIKRDTPNLYEFTGFVEAQQEANITANVSGKITSKNFNGGDWVEAGQVLFSIDQRTYRANVLNAQAGVGVAAAFRQPLQGAAEFIGQPQQGVPALPPAVLQLRIELVECGGEQMVGSLKMGEQARLSGADIIQQGKISGGWHGWFAYA